MAGIFNHLYSHGGALALSGNRFRKQLLRFGEWVHPNKPGQKLKITRELVQKLVDNFHAGILDNVPVPDTHTKSAVANTGYVVGLEMTDDGLDGILKIEDESALEKIKKGLIPGISVSFSESYIDKETGKDVGPVLFHAALVDNPYLKGMRSFEPVMMGDEDEDSVHVPYIRDEGGLKMTKEQLLAALKDEHSIDVVALQDQLKELETAKADAKAAKSTLEAVQAAVGENVELSDDVGVLDGVKKLVAKIKASETEATKLEDRVKSLEEAGRQRDAKDAVKDLVRENKVAPADVDKFEKLYLADKDLFSGIVETLKPVVDLGEHGVDPGSKPGEDSAIDEQAEIDRIASSVGL